MDKAKKAAIGILISVVILIFGLAALLKLAPGMIQVALIIVGVIAAIALYIWIRKATSKSDSAKPVKTKTPKARDWFWAEVVFYGAISLACAYLFVRFFIPGLYERVFGKPEVKAAQVGKTIEQAPILDRWLTPGKVLQHELPAGPVLIKLRNYTEDIKIRVLDENGQSEEMLAKPEDEGKYFYYAVDPQTGKVDKKATTYQLYAEKRTRVRVFQYNANYQK